MERYNEYKDSGVQWLGEIPSHWETRTLKYCCSLKGRIGWNGLRSEEFQDASFAYLVTGQDFIGSEIDWSKCYQISKERYEEDPYIQLNNGDMLITKDGTIGKVAKVTNLDKPACLNSGIFVIKQKGSYFNQGFLYWMLCSNVLKEFNVYTQTGATIAHLYQNVFENMPCLLPPISEQQTISDYLDTATAKIDAAIAQQQKMIDLLNERKQIIINNAVTKGLNPNVPMKESDVDWIGEIPESWIVRRGKFLFDIVNEYSTTGEEELLTVSDRTGITPRSMKNVTMFMAETLVGYKKCKVGDICSNIMWMWHGAVGVTQYDGVISPSYGVYRQKNDNYDNEYLDMMLRLPRLVKLYASLSTGLTESRLRLYPDDFMNICFFIPPIEEQRNIVANLKALCAPIDGAITNATKQISLLQERKQIIINDVVTGKVKVS